MLGNRSASARHTSGVVSQDYWQFTPGQRVMTREGIAGTVTEVVDGPYPGAEEYEVTLDDGLGGGAYGPSEIAPLDGRLAAVVAKDYEGETGNASHITRNEKGTLPTAAIAHLGGARGEMPGEHRNRLGEKWEAFKADIAANGIQNPIFITVDYGQDPKISEGNHRRDVAVELGLDEVPVEIRYFGNAQMEGSVEERARRSGMLHEAMRSAWKGNLPCSSCGATDAGEDGEGGVCTTCASQHAAAYLVEDEVRAIGREYLDAGGSLYGPDEMADMATVRTAAEDYPELGTILEDRPPLQHAVTAALGGTCSACGGTGEQGNGYECYICDGSGTASAEAEGRAAGTTNANPENGLPEGIDLAAGLSSTLAGWFTDKVLYPAAERANEKLDPTHQYQPGTSWSYDWCRFRKNRRCMYPTHMDADATAQRGYAVWVPQDRGLCPRDSWDDQKVCPVGEPGEHSGDPEGRPLVAASLQAEAGTYELAGSWPAEAVADQGITCPYCRGAGEGGRMPVPRAGNKCGKCKGQGFLDARQMLGSKLPFEFTASWSDVRSKAKRIRTEGGVRIVATPGDFHMAISAEVRGDHGIYQTIVLREPGRQAVASWECGCAWSSYSWGRSGRWKRYEGRMCSHALALVYEAQAQGMFGRTIQTQPQTPPWRADTSIPVQQPTNYPKPRRKAASHPVSTDPSLQAPPVLEFARAALGEGAQPTAVLHGLVRLGVKDAPSLMTLALRGGPIRAKVRGWVKKVIDVLTGGIVVLEDGTQVTESEVFYPTYDPTLGLDLADSTPHVSAKTAMPSERDTMRNRVEYDPPLMVRTKRNITVNQGWGMYMHSTGETVIKVPVGTEVPAIASYDDAQGNRRYIIDASKFVAKEGGEYTHSTITVAEAQLDVPQAAQQAGTPVTPPAERVKCPAGGLALEEGWNNPAVTCPLCGQQGVKNARGYYGRHWVGPDFAAWAAQHPNWARVRASMPDKEYVFYLEHDGRNPGSGKQVYGAKNPVPSVAGVAIKAKDTGRVLLIQRSNKDESDPARGTWEFPGGHMAENESPWDAGKREWEEETGHPFPPGEYAGHWLSPNGIYQGHIWMVPSEDSVRCNLDPEDRHVLNPDDPDGDDIEVMAWWDPKHLPDNPGVRKEVRSTPWDLIKKADKDPRFEGVGLKQDDDGWYVTTHRARSDSYPTPEAIPQADVDFIESTGAQKQAGSWWGEDPEDDYEYSNEGDEPTDPIKAWECQYCGARNPEWASECSACDRCSICGEVLPEGATPQETFRLRQPHRDRHFHLGVLVADWPPRPEFGDSADGWMGDTVIWADQAGHVHGGYPYDAIEFDPSRWDLGIDPDHSPLPFTQAALDEFAFEGELHDEPEPALPITDGDAMADDDLEESSDSSRLSAGIQTYDDLEADGVSEVATTASLRPAWLSPSAPASGAGPAAAPGNTEIAQAARAFLKQGMKAFSPAEQAAIISEGEGVTAANLDRLDISGTHYEALEAALATEDEDPEELFI